MMEFSQAIRVYYEDTDTGGVVYHSKYLNYCERARTEALRSLGFEQDVLIDEEDTIFAVRSIEVDYLKPARFNDEIIVKTRVETLKKASITFSQTILLKSDAQVLCRLSARVACLTASGLRPRAIPQAIVNQMEALSAG